MAVPAPEIAKEQLDRVRPIAELAKTNPEQFKDQVKSLTLQELNTLSNFFGKELKDDVATDVREQIRARLDKLREEKSVDVNLEMLSGRYTALNKFLAEPRSNSERLKQDVDTAANQVTGFVGSTYEFMRNNMVKPLAEQTKDWFLIGPIVGSLGDLSPAHIKRAVSRKWHQFLANADTFGGTDSKNFLGKMFFRVADDARQKLAMLDVHDVVEEYQEEKKAGETIALDERMQPDQWRRMREALQKNPRAMAERTAAVINERRKANVLAIKINVADLLKTDAEVVEQAKTQRTEQLKTKMLALESWKNAGITSVAFNADETSIGNGTLTVVEADLDESGAPKPNTRATAVLEAKKTLTNADKIVISKDVKDIVTLNWNAPKTVTLPMKTAVASDKINDLAGKPQPDRFSLLEIGASDAIANDEVQLISRNGSNVLVAENNPQVLAAIAEGKPKIDTAEASPKYKLKNGEFTFMPVPTPVRPPAA